jgi:N6-adenosine-specific RNA methylase IME4
MDFPTKKYHCIVADPPWQYDNKRTGGSMSSGAIQQYPTMSMEEIRDLPVKSITERDCILFLWVTVPLKIEIARSGIIEKWGFQYKTSLFWRKVSSLGLGFWFRNQVEECWLCTKGNMKAFRSSNQNIFESKIRKHSQKPDEFWELIQPFTPKPGIELFAREKREGWDCWGNEIEGNISFSI